VDNGTASGKIIILDTLKKFTELMDKRIASDFMREAREFVSNGGTLILLAHTNKNRDGNGKVIFGGTSDIVDDADCAYTLDEVGGDNSTKHVIFENMKCRGDVAKDAGYSYSIVKGVTYIERLESIASLDDEQVDQAKQTKLNTERMKKDGAAIKSIVELLERGDLLKTDLLHNVHQDTGLSKARIIRVMSDYEGTDFNKGNRWFVLRGDKNAKIYSLNRQFELHDNGLDDLSFSDDSNDVF
jgi:hypothetical protein